jgi:hypothetical protein
MKRCFHDWPQRLERRIRSKTAALHGVRWLTGALILLFLGLGFSSCVNLPPPESPRDSGFVLPVVRQRSGRASTFGYVEVFISKPGDPGFTRKIKAYAGSGLEIVTGLEPGRYEISRYQFRYKNDGGYGSSGRIEEPFLLEAGTLTVSPITILVSEYRKYPGADTVWMSVRWAPVMQQERAEIAQRLVRCTL